MSAVAKFHKKVFKKLIVKPLKQAWKHRKELMIAAAVVYGVGLASGAFQAPWSGMGATLAESATPATTFLESSAAAGTNVGASVGSTAATTAAAAPVATAAAIPGAAPAAGTTAGAGAGATAESTGIIDSLASGAKAVGSAVKEFPVATMLLGSGVSSAYAAKQAKEAEEAERANRGLMGYDIQGNYAGKSGIIDSQATKAAPTQQTRAITRKNLAKIQPQDVKA